MIKEYADKLCAWLRDPSNKQTTGVLFDGEGYCCLGGICVIERLQPLHTQQQSTYWAFQGEGELPNSYSLPDSIQKKWRMYSQVGITRDDVGVVIDGKHYGHLAAANDQRVPFPNLADWIEANYERL